LWDDLVVGREFARCYDELAALVATPSVELTRAREEITALRAEVSDLKHRLGTNCTSRWPGQRSCWQI
jgi:hypothetical protein